MKMTNTEKGHFLKLFIRSGHVLDFNIPSFDAFTMDSIGIAIHAQYNLSKGRSLTQYVKESKDEDSTKLLLDFFKYYEEEYPYFHYETGYGNDDEEKPIWTRITNNNLPECKKQYEKCKEIVDRLTAGTQFTENAANNIKEAFSSEYINKQVDIMIQMQTEHPTDAIGKAKELIESCSKAILEAYAQPIDKDWDLTRLTREAMGVLKLLPKHVDPNNPAAETLKAILASLSQIAHRTAELRNPYGSGHGKNPAFIGLEERHAKLVVGSALALVNFLWESHNSQQNHPQMT